MEHFNLSFRLAPFARPAISYIIGLLSVSFIDLNIEFIYVILALCTCVMAVSYFHSFSIIFGFSFLLTCFAFGNLQLTHLNSQIDTPHHSSMTNLKLIFTGTIKGKVLKTKNGLKVKMPLAIKSISLHNDTVDVILHKNLNVIAFAELKDSNLNKLKMGDEIILDGVLAPIAKSLNPHAFNYKQYMFNKGFTYNLFASNIRVTDTNNFSLKSYFQSIQVKLVSIVKEYICHPDAFSIAVAMTLGHKDDLSDNIQEVYRKTGAAHIIAVSGLHIDIITFIIFILLGKNKLSNVYLKLLQLSILILLIWSYALLVGSTASVVRAAIMFTLGILAQALSKKVNIWNILSVTALFMLFYNPRYIFDISFQFSFLGIISIVYFLPKLRFLNPFKQNRGRKWVDIILVSVAVQILIAPLSIYYFNYFPIGFLIANAILFIFIYLIIIGTFSIIISSFFVDTLTIYLSSILENIIKGLNTFLSYVSQIESVGIDNIYLSQTDVFIIYGYISLVILIEKKPSLQNFKLCAFLLLVHSAYSFYSKEKTQNQAQIVVYHCPQNNLLDFIYKDRCYSYSSNKNSYPFRTDNNRIANGIKNVIYLSENAYQDNYIRHCEHVIEFFDYKILIEFEDQYENIEDFDMIIAKPNYTPQSYSQAFILNTPQKAPKQIQNSYTGGAIIKKIDLQ